MVKFNSNGAYRHADINASINIIDNYVDVINVSIIGYIC